MTAVDQVLHPVIDVVTTGTDWPAITAAIVTGIAAVVGIGGTAWQAKRARQAASADLQKSVDAAAANLLVGINAEDVRADRAVKRQIYSQFQAALDDVFLSVSDLQITTRSAEDGSEALVARAKQVTATLVTLFKALAEVRLIAPPPVADKAIDAVYAAFVEAQASKDPDHEYDGDSSVFNERQDLYREMRADLGVPEAPAPPASAGVPPGSA